MDDEALQTFLATTRDSREYKRGLAVQMVRRGIEGKQVAAQMGVSDSFVSKWKVLFEEHGVEVLRMGYRGSEGWLTGSARAETLAWIAAQPSCTTAQVVEYLETTHGIVYQSMQSYYALMHEAGLAWKKVQASNPKKTTNR